MTTTKSQSIQRLLDSLIPNREQLMQQGRCVHCEEEVDYEDLLPLDRKEYDISGTCPACWTRMFEDEE